MAGNDAIAKCRKTAKRRPCRHWNRQLNRSIEASASNAVAATPSTADFAALIDEVSGIEAKLGEAMQVIADIDAAQTSAANAGGTGDSE